mmetsp:Transcript_17657/g.38699  ORF Transcript_17657/g.38699 Transcript_17657/m.38699 type:complete len:227 (-) Transcript_17657:364-1044(-)
MLEAGRIRITLGLQVALPAGIAVLVSGFDCHYEAFATHDVDLQIHELQLGAIHHARRPLLGFGRGLLCCGLGHDGARQGRVSTDEPSCQSASGEVNQPSIVSWTEGSARSAHRHKAVCNTLGGPILVVIGQVNHAIARRILGIDSWDRVQTCHISACFWLKVTLEVSIAILVTRRHYLHENISIFNGHLQIYKFQLPVVQDEGRPILGLGSGLLARCLRDHGAYQG